MRVKVLFTPTNPYIEKLAQNIAEEAGCKCDKIPPSYPCENEKITFIGFDAHFLFGGASQDVQNLCERLEASQTKEVAFFITETFTQSNILQLKRMLELKKIKVNDDIFICKRKFLYLFNAKSPTENDYKKIKEWSRKIMDNVD